MCIRYERSHDFTNAHLSILPEILKHGIQHTATQSPMATRTQSPKNRKNQYKQPQVHISQERTESHHKCTIHVSFFTHSHTHTHTHTHTHIHTTRAYNFAPSGNNSAAAAVIASFPVSRTLVWKSTLFPSFHISVRSVWPGTTVPAKRTLMFLNFPKVW